MSSLRLSKSQKIMACLWSIALMLGLSFTATSAQTAFALDKGGLSGTGSITVTKYKSVTDGVAGTGKADQTPSGTTVPGVTFKIQKLDTSKVEGEGATAITKSDQIPADEAAVSAFVTTYKDANVAEQSGTTAADGTYKFDTLVFGYYLLWEVESTAPADTDPCVPTIVTLPYKTSSDGSYIKDVNVYPKNKSNKNLSKVLTELKDADDNDIEHVTAGAKLKYQISQTLPTAADEVYKAGATPDSMTLTIYDWLPYADNATKSAALDYDAANSTVKFVLADGSTVDAADYFTVNSSVKATEDNVTNNSADAEGVPGISWTLKADKVQALAALYATNAPVSVLIDIAATANENVIQIKGDVKNTTASTMTKAGSTDKQEEKDDTNWDGDKQVNFNITKVDSAKTAITSKVGFKITETYNADAAQATYLDSVDSTLTATSQDGYEFTSESNGGSVSFNDLYAMSKAKNVTGGIADKSDSLLDALKAEVEAAADPSTVADKTDTVDIYLYESTVPTGFKPLVNLQKLTLKLTASYDNTLKKYKVSGTLLNANDDGTGAQVTQIVNEKDGEGAFKLPNTGGVGTILFTVAGIVLIGCAVAYFVRSRRKAEAR